MVVVCYVELLNVGCGEDRNARHKRSIQLLTLVPVQWVLTISLFFDSHWIRQRELPKFHLSAPWN